MAILSGDKKSVKVEKGDTLSEIARDYKSYSGNASYQKLAQINGISNPNLIYVGQTIKLTGKASSSTTSSNKATIDAFGLQSNSNNTLFATWKWTKSNTEHYETMWQYSTGDGVWFVGSDSTTKYTQSTWNIPDNAKQVRFRVKPISKKKTNSKGKETSPWEAEWCTWKKYNVSDLPPTAPSSAPSIEIEKYKLTAKLENIDVESLNAKSIRFQVVQDDKTPIITDDVTIVKDKKKAQYGFISHSWNITAGHKYKVRCKSVRNKLESDWTAFSNNEQAIPSVPSSITQCKASTETSVYLEWSKVESADNYDIEYTTNKNYFDNAGDTTTVSTTEPVTKFTIHKLSGGEYFFRVRAVNEKGSSDWSGIKSVKIGEPPSAPTTWSSTTTATVGDPLNLYWVHNSEDGSSQTFARLEIIADGVTKTFDIENTTDLDEKDKTSVYSVDTSQYSEGTQLKWRVATAGVTRVPGEYSIQRTVDINAPATLTLTVTDKFETAPDGTITLLEPDNGAMDTLKHFPFYIKGVAGPSKQAPIGYHLTVIAKENYTTIDQVGLKKTISEGDEVYSKYFDISTVLLVEMSAGNIDLENGIEYEIRCIVSMNSGLTAEAFHPFTVEWVDAQYTPNAEISIDEDNYSASIRAYCEETYNEYYRCETDSDGHASVAVEMIDESELDSLYTSSGEQVHIGLVNNQVIYYCISYFDENDEPIDPIYHQVSENSGTYEITDVVLDPSSISGLHHGQLMSDEEIIEMGVWNGQAIRYVMFERTTPIEGVTLSVYRRDYDGSFTELATGLENTSMTFITDPHPALDYARYRIVAVTDSTGAVSYYDLPGYPVGGKAVIIQWGEEWSSFNSWSEDPLAEPSWSGSLLKLPYNIDVSDSNDSDVTLVKYIGRKRPVTYYGTQLGEKSTWNVVIEKDDEETLYSLRRLAIWSGDVYVREPSGSGYWANMKVSFSQKHRDLTIPVTLDITRVEGGI